MKNISSQTRGVIRPTLFVILDGFGLADIKDKGNAITPDTAPHIFSYMKSYPSAQLVAHGRDVGLFPGQAGNSEAGHLNIGAGRLVKQDIVMISDCIKDGTFFKNESFHQALLHAQEHKSNIHIMGLLTDGQSAHAHPDHVRALLEYFRKNKAKNIFLHLFTDGRDAPPHSAVQYINLLKKQMKNGERIASVTGRFYGMDRNKNWDRTQRAYEALVEGKALHAETAEEAISAAYNRGENDEYISPTLICNKEQKPITIQDNDVVLFFNTRSDRARQLTKSFVQNKFNALNPDSFKRRKIRKNIKFVAMTDFGPDLPTILTAFPSKDVSNCLAQAIGTTHTQLYISETEKYAHVTYFLNGGYPAPIDGETRELLKSSDIYNFAKRPAMRTKEVTKKIISYIKKGTYNFVTVNFPNADMLGHTGNIEATKIGIKVIDDCTKAVVDAVLKKKGRVIIVGDHGNAEEMLGADGREVNTEHSTNPVPFIIIDPLLNGKKVKPGRLADVAPTLLKLMGIQKPKEMTGKCLID